MLTGTVRVTDVQSGKLKRWEDSYGESLAKVDKNGKLRLTELGRRRGYKVKGLELVEAEK